jgi:hypothetical protein
MLLPLRITLRQHAAHLQLMVLSVIWVVFMVHLASPLNAMTVIGKILQQSAMLLRELPKSLVGLQLAVPVPKFALIGLLEPAKQLIP